MLGSAFKFYRGTNHLFFHDFSTLKKASGDLRKLEYDVWMQGDMHTENLGSFANRRGEVVYDLNDFDESTVGDFQYDLWRMAVSVILSARDGKLVTTEMDEKALVRSYLDGYDL